MNQIHTSELDTEYLIRSRLLVTIDWKKLITIYGAFNFTTRTLGSQTNTKGKILLLLPAIKYNRCTVYIIISARQERLGLKVW